jgi:hypothetical protein
MNCARFGLVATAISPQAIEDTAARKTSRRCFRPRARTTEIDPAITGTGLPYMRTLQFGARLEF